MKRAMGLMGLTAGLLSAGVVLAAGTPAQKCQGGKNELAAKYAACRGKAEKKLATAGDNSAYADAIGKCDARYATGWSKLEEKAATAGGVCVDVVAENDLRNFVSACSDVVADVAAGGALPADVVTCNDQLATCVDDLAAAELCGNGAIDAGEDCDFGTLNGATCVTEGFTGGVLSCDNGCGFDTDGCYAARFVDNADGTISDNDTGLMWEKKIKLNGSPDGADAQDADNPYRWSGSCSIGGTRCQPDAVSAAACLAGTQGDTSGCAQCVSGVCNVGGTLGTVWQWLGGLNTAAFAGYNDWRLPTRAELWTLLDDGQVTWNPPVIDAAFKSPGCGSACADPASAACSCAQSGNHWSATVYVPNSNFAWIVNFEDGGVSAAGKPTGSYYVRAVRGGS